MTTAQRVSQIQTAARKRRRDLDQLVGVARSLATRGKVLESEISKMTTDVEVYKQVNVLLTSIGEDRQSLMQQRIEQLVTHGLQTIYSEDLSFHIVQEVKRDQSQVSFLIRSTINGTEVITPVVNARGGGIVATVSFVLRVVVALLAGHKPVFIFDEVFAHVSPDYELRVAEFLRDLVDQVGIQVIMVTHSDAYSDLADVAYRFSTTSGETVIERQ